ncbi:MAG: phosphoesterase [Chloroflexi bacterium]|nr:phosphoesterase [Chloroflexota bacterium]
MTIFFTADTHFGHVNVIRFCNRPYSSAAEMDEKLIENWNQEIGPDNTIYHLGDFTLLGNEPAEEYFQHLNGKIHIIPGGHDHRWTRNGTYHSKSDHPVVILPPLQTIKFPLRDSGQPQLIVLCHYSLRVWDRSHYGSWNLYGHSHGNLPPLENSLDVGVDCWDYHPVSLEDINREFQRS